MRARVLGVVAAGALASACFGGSGGGGAASGAPEGPDRRAALTPPVVRGGWTFFGAGQGLSADVQDVSADEAGNAYVAGGDALYARRPGDQAFLRFDAANAGLTRNCNELAAYFDEAPPTPFRTCRIIAVAGGAPGVAVIGFDSFNIEPQTGALWTYRAGGADVVAFDAAKGTAARTRHVWFASPPHTICTKPVYGRTDTCDPDDYWWRNGRRIFTRVRRLVVNHDRGSPLYGDVWAGGQHATFAALLAGAAARGLPDRTAGMGPEWADARDVWEHVHPQLDGENGEFINGEGWAMSIDPRTGEPWGSNAVRTTYIPVGWGTYGPDLAKDDFWMGERLDFWPDPPGTVTVAGATGPQADEVRSISHCADGTLWIGSLRHGLARRAPDGKVTFPPLPAGAGGVAAVACDPADDSVWIGLSAGGVLRLRGGGTFERLDPAGLPGFVQHPVQSIQIDRWSRPRVVWFAFPPATDGSGRIVAGGGVAAYAGP